MLGTNNDKLKKKWSFDLAVSTRRLIVHAMWLQHNQYTYEAATSIHMLNPEELAPYIRLNFH